MDWNPVRAAAKRLAKWLLPHIKEEIQKEVDRRRSGRPAPRIGTDVPDSADETH